MEGNITSRQVIQLMMISRLATTISLMPALNIRPYNQDVWMVILLSIVYTHIFTIPLLVLAKKFKTMTMIGYLENIYGKILGKLLGFLYLLYFVINVFNISTIQAELVATTILSDTSEILIIICMVLTVIYCVSRGLQAGLRAVEILTPMALFIVISMIFLGANSINFELILPIFADSTILDINLGSMQLSLYFKEVFILTMFVPYLEDKEDIQKIFTKSLIFSMLLLSVSVLVSQLTLGVDYLKHTNFPFLHYARTIELLRLFERIDIIAITGWLITGIPRLSAAIMLSALAVKEVLEMDYLGKKATIIIGIAAIAIKTYILGTRSVIITRNDIDMLLNILFIVFVIIIPSITCIVYFIRRKSIESKNS